MLVLLAGVRNAGRTMGMLAPTDPVRGVEGAIAAYTAAREVASELQATDPAIAWVAQELRTNAIGRQLDRLAAANGGFGPEDVPSRGSELEKFGELLVRELSKRPDHAAAAASLST
jgi:hypothetical protein